MGKGRTRKTEKGSARPDSGPDQRYWVAGLSLALGLLFGSAAFYLPWKLVTVFSLLTSLLAASHLSTAILALLGHRRWRTSRR